ncbi:MAG TPA: UDP-N-acetylmuramoyl-L-alanine--D-glutamate ligase [Actinomycetota bacterium]
MTGALDGSRVLVVGGGVAGASAATVLVAEGAAVRLSDRRPREALDADAIEAAGVELRAGGHRREDLDDVDVVVVSPGVPPSNEILGWAAERGLPVWGEMELGARLARMPYVAVTGTNGKTTTSGMLTSCLAAAGLDAKACGNIGDPFPAAARGDHDVLVVEVSSFQLVHQESFHPRVSVLLNVAPDHLDWHGTPQAYAAAKARVFAAQGDADAHVGNRDDAAAAAISATAPCPVWWFRAGEPRDGEVGYVGDDLVARVAGEVRLGPVAQERAGYRADAAAAAAAGLVFGIDPGAVAEGLASFRPAAHRGEVVAEVEGVRFLDNSKATNVHAAIAAIAAVPGAVLIAGGRAKGQDLGALASQAQGLRAVVAIGESAQDIVRVFAGVVPVSVAPSIEEATSRAFDAARPSGVVLLAPACASWDQFRDYAERGDRFAAAARALEESSDG